MTHKPRKAVQRTPEQRAAQEWVQGRLRWERWLRGLEGQADAGTSAADAAEGAA